MEYSATMQYSLTGWDDDIGLYITEEFIMKKAIYPVQLNIKRNVIKKQPDGDLLKAITAIYKSPKLEIKKVYREDGTQISIPDYAQKITVYISGFVKNVTSPVTVMGLYIPYNFISEMRTNGSILLHRNYAYDTKMQYSIGEAYDVSVKTTQDVVSEGWHHETVGQVIEYRKWNKTGETDFVLEAEAALESLYMLDIANMFNDVNDIFTSSIVSVNNESFFKLVPGSNFPDENKSIRIIR